MNFIYKKSLAIYCQLRYCLTMMKKIHTFYSYLYYAPSSANTLTLSH